MWSTCDCHALEWWKPAAVRVRGGVYVLMVIGPVPGSRRCLLMNDFCLFPDITPEQVVLRCKHCGRTRVYPMFPVPAGYFEEPPLPTWFQKYLFMNYTTHEGVKLPEPVEEIVTRKDDDD